MKSIALDNFSIEQTEEKEVFQLETSRLFDDSPVCIPAGLISNEGDKKVCILSGQHGNEWNGIYSSQKFFKNVSYEKINGTLIVLPIVNPLAFNEKSRVSSIDNIDLNRTYLNNSYRKPAEQIGKKLFNKLFGEMDFIVDIHSGGPGEYLPHVAITKENQVEKASKFLFSDVYLETRTFGSLASACAKENIPSFTIEAGLQRDIDQAYVNATIKGLKNFLKSVDMLDGKAEKNEPVVHVNKERITSPASGFFTPEVDLGIEIEKGKRVGRLEKLFDGKQVVEASTSGKVLYLRREEVVALGENLLHITW